MQLRLRPNLLTLPNKLPQRLLVACVWILALGLTAWICAIWYWHLNGTPIQSARATPISDPLAAAQDVASRQLFGVTVATATAEPNAPSAQQTLTVVGVTTRWGKLNGFALIKNGPAAADSFVEGDTITPGVKLVRVLADAIEIERNGVREQIKLSVSPRQGADAPQNRTNQPGSASAPAAEN